MTSSLRKNFELVGAAALLTAGAGCASRQDTVRAIALGGVIAGSVASAGCGISKPSEGNRARFVHDGCMVVGASIAITGGVLLDSEIAPSQVREEPRP